MKRLAGIALRGSPAAETIRSKVRPCCIVKNRRKLCQDALISRSAERAKSWVMDSACSRGSVAAPFRGRLEGRSLGLAKRFLPRRFSVGPPLILVLLMACGCAVRRTTHVPTAQVPLPTKEASLAQLMDRVNGQNPAIRTMNATDDLSPAAGSIYSGVIKEYHDVRGFILVEKPELIRMIGQAPVVRTNIFDMVSNGQQFELYLPTKRKFIVGKTTFHRPAKNALESLRPQHILDALLVPNVDSKTEKCFLKEDEEGVHRYYVLEIVHFEPGGEALSLEREL